MSAGLDSMSCHKPTLSAFCARWRQWMAGNIEKIPSSSDCHPDFWRVFLLRTVSWKRKMDSDWKNQSGQTKTYCDHFGFPHDIDGFTGFGVMDHKNHQPHLTLFQLWKALHLTESRNKLPQQNSHGFMGDDRFALPENHSSFEKPTCKKFVDWFHPQLREAMNSRSKIPAEKKSVETVTVETNSY